MSDASDERQGTGAVPEPSGAPPEGATTARRAALRRLAARAGVAVPMTITLLAPDPARSQDTGLSGAGGDEF